MGESSPLTPSNPPDAVQLEPGCELDRYELLAPYARGGMACVWLGRVRGKHGFERLVAIKTILPEYATEPDFRTMMADEARIASAIEHPNVAHIIDVGEDLGTFYIVLEWVDGDSLYALHRLNDKQKKLLPVPIVLRAMADACRGLHAAHELADREGHPLGVVHRDVSPHNVLVSATTGVAKLIDFGVAKAQGRLGGNTSAGVIKGKVRFMAPEQALGGEVDRRADIWSVGATLQYLLTGTYPYASSNDLEVLMALTQGTPPAPLPESVHPKIAEVVAKALVPDATKRYSNALALSRAIESAMAAANCRASTADVVTYLEQAARSLRERRQKAIDLAVSAAEGRGKYSDLLQPIAPPGESAHSGARTKPGRERAASIPDVSTPVVGALLGAPAASEPAMRATEGSAPSYRAAIVRTPAPPPPEGTGTVASRPGGETRALAPVATPAATPPARSGSGMAVGIVSVIVAILAGAGLAVWWTRANAPQPADTTSAEPAPVAASNAAPASSPAAAAPTPPAAGSTSASVATPPSAVPTVVSVDQLPVAPAASTTSPPRPRWTPPPASPPPANNNGRNFGF
jgi:eukaryotic-like serine/threonine-protein kinase